MLLEFRRKNNECLNSYHIEACMKMTKTYIIMNRKHTKFIEVWLQMNQAVVVSKHPKSRPNDFNCSRLKRRYSLATWIT